MEQLDHLFTATSIVEDLATGTSVLERGEACWCPAGRCRVMPRPFLRVEAASLVLASCRSGPRLAAWSSWRPTSSGDAPVGL